MGCIGQAAGTAGKLGESATVAAAFCAQDRRPPVPCMQLGQLPELLSGLGMQQSVAVQPLREDAAQVKAGLT